jgi:hypothetical protein
MTAPPEHVAIKKPGGALYCQTCGVRWPCLAYQAAVIQRLKAAQAE